jgi:hypothetical protein
MFEYMLVFAFGVAMGMFIIQAVELWGRRSKERRYADD